jgi:hypothetical protein
MSPYFHGETMKTSQRSRGLAAIASFAITLVLFHGVASLAAPSAVPAMQLAKTSAPALIR